MQEHSRTKTAKNKYNLRTRKNKLQVSRTGSEEDSETDSFGDPEFTLRLPRRQEHASQMAEDAAAATTSTRNLRTVCRKRGHPQNHAVNIGVDNQHVHIPRNRRRNAETRFSSNKRAGSSKQADNSEDRRTILSWLIDLGIVDEDSEVLYKGRTVWTGKITRVGILCTCCGKVLTVWEFEVHAKSDLRRPYEHIFVKNTRKSLLQCLMKAWQEHIGHATPFQFLHSKSTATDQNDDSCLVCTDGGELMCCDNCPSAFHPSCINMERVPESDWFCSYCCCKQCGLSGGNFLTCSLCEKKFHPNCSDAIDLNHSISSFCSKSCSKICEKLEQMVGIKNEFDEGYSWTLLKNEDINTKDNLHSKLESNCKIAVAGVLMDQCFETIIDRFTGIDVVQSVMCSKGSDLSRINFSGFYAAILEKNEEIISAASLRIHGSKIAEMPFVATDKKYRRQGLLGKLLLAIESALCSLKVENLVIPSSEEVVEMWTQKFKFSHIEDDLTKELNSLNTLMFPKAVRLQKRCLACSPEADITAAMEATEVDDHDQDNGQNRFQQNGNGRPPLIDLNLDPADERPRSISSVLGSIDDL